MNSKEMVQQTLKGEPTPRPVNGPLAVHYCARIAGVTLREYSLNVQTMTDSILAYYERFKPDAIWISADTWVSAEAMGARVACLDDNLPLSGIGEPCIQNVSDIDRIAPATLCNRGRWPLMIEALNRVRNAIGNEVFIVACFDQYPFSLACALLGIQTAMLKSMEDPSFLEALMEKTLEYGEYYASLLASAGADLLSGGDSPAGLLGPHLYRTIALPYEQRLITRLKTKTDIPISLHICGNTMPILKELNTSGADVLELDHYVNMAQALTVIDRDTAVWGNIDTVSVLAGGTPVSVAEKVSDLLVLAEKFHHRRLVVSSGCTLAMETPPENIDALIRACHHFRSE